MPETGVFADGWNRNTHYHDRLLAALPADCRRVLDVGCGQGAFARRLARIAHHVDALDVDADTLAGAEASSRHLRNVRFVQADFLRWESDDAYDAVSMIAVLHHLPFQPTLRKATALLRPGGVLLVLGLDRSPSFVHALLSGGVARLLSSWYGVMYRSSPVGAPIAEPHMTLREIRDASATLLPGAVVRRHALLRYSMVWRKV